MAVTARERTRRIQQRRRQAALKAARLPGTRAEKLAKVPTERITYQQLRERDGDRCQLCGYEIDFDALYADNDGQVNPMYRTLDHKYPIALGGFDTLDNSQASHMCCNSAKGDRVSQQDIDDFTDLLVAHRIPFRVDAFDRPYVEDEVLAMVRQRGYWNNCR
jgi:5-methylcytosine-specific restriction endonuclease McrA